MKTTNGFLMLSLYQRKNGLEATVKNGMATVRQKQEIVGLTLLADYECSGVSYKKGQKALFKENVLHSAPWAKDKFKLEGMDQEFMLAEISSLVGII